jgi:hypothetical protein
MQINANCNYNNTNFKAKSLVQIPRKVFSNPENIAECSRVFSEKVRQISGEKVKGALGALLAMFFPKLVKSLTVLEGFSHGYTKEAMESNNIAYTLDWFKQNTGLDIPTKPLNEDLHSFYVYTKKDKGKALKSVKEAIKNTKLYITEGINKYTDDKTLDYDAALVSAYTIAKMGVETDRLLNEYTKETPLKTFRLESVEELDKIAKELDF